MGRGQNDQIKRTLTAFFAGLVLMGFAANAQTSDIGVGMWVKLSPCKQGAKTFNHIDLYTKTLFKDTIIPVDTATGEGLFESFFTPGEFDGKRLTCAYANKRYRVASLREFEVKGVMQRVMLLYTDKFNELIWVQFDKAVEAREISW